MRRLALGASIVATIVAGVWVSIACAWVVHFDRVYFHED